MLEFYCAYMDVNGMMDFCEELLRQVIKTVTGKTVIWFVDGEIDFGSKFARMSMRKAIEKFWQKMPISAYFLETVTEEWLSNSENVVGLVSLWDWWLSSGVVSEVHETKTSELDKIEAFSSKVESEWRSIKEKVSLGVPPEETIIAQYVQRLFEEMAEPHLSQPTFLTDFPKAISPLSKASPHDQTIAERFELYVNGMECANGFSELNDPLEQYERFKEQGRARERGDEEAMQMDTDYVRALAYGMPPAAGIGIGIDRVVMLLTNRRSIRDVILFPHMRPAAPKSEETTEHPALPVEQAGEQAESTNEQAGEQEV
jgi:lysyl-tRNA synthetase class 2